MAAQLEIYDRDGTVIQVVAATQDEHDESKWHLAESVALGPSGAESAVLRFGDGTSQRVPASVFAGHAPIDTLVSDVPGTPVPDDPPDPVDSL
ncbi:MAG: hypothetical protein QOI71_1374 [Gaiellales bacterium]|nr:hypothetical protein [Gaiellales bacterium]